MISGVHNSRALTIAALGVPVLIAAVLTGCAGSTGADSGAAIPSTAARTVTTGHAFAATLPSQLLFVPTGNEIINIYALRDPNKRGPLAQIAAGLVGTQYQMTTDSASDLFVVNDNFLKANEQYVSVYPPPYTGSPTILSGVTFPLGVAVDASGTVYVSNCGADCSQTPAVYLYQNGSTTPTGSITSPEFSSLGGLTVDAAGNLYVAESNRTTGASDVFEVPAGSSVPKALHLKGLFNIGGPGISKVAVDSSGDLFVGNNSNSTYFLEFKPGKNTAERIIDPFAFFDVPGMIAYGPDGNLYVSIYCSPGSSCDGSVLGFKPKGSTPFEVVGASAPVYGVATAPNGNFAARPTHSPVAYLRCAQVTRIAALEREPCAPPTHAKTLPIGTIGLNLLPPPARASKPLLRRVRSATQRGGGWLSPQATGKHLIYMSVAGNGTSVPSSIQIYPALGQTQLPIGSITNGISTPEGIATDATGNLYVANSGNNTVTVYPRGHVAPSITYSNGIGAPYDVTVGSDGTVYVANAFATNSGYGTVTEYPSGSTNPKVTITNAGQNAVAVALDASNNLYVSWFNLSTAQVEIDKYAPGSTSGKNLNLDLPAPSFPSYALAFDHQGNLLAWYEGYDHSTKYLASFAPGASEPSRTVPGGSFLDVVTGIAVPRSSNKLYLAALNVNEGDELTYPKGLPLDVIGLNSAEGIALSPGT